MRRFLCCFFVLLLLLSTTVLNVSAANDGTVGAQAYCAVPGDTVEIPIKYTDNPGFWIMFLGIYFDSEIFEYVDIENGDYNKADIKVNTYSNPGKIVLDIEGTEYVDLTGDGVIATLKLKVKENAPVGNYAVVLSIGDGMVVNFDVQYVEPTIEYGSVYVVCGTHEFEDDTCTVCGAVRSGEEITVDLDKLPEAVKPAINDEDVSDSQDAVSGSVSDALNKVDSDDPDKTDSDGANKPNTVMLTALCCVAVLAVVAVVVFVIIKKKKNNT